MIRFGPAGIPLSCKGRTLKDGIEDVHILGLTAMEIQLVRVNLLERYAGDEEIGLTPKTLPGEMVVEIGRTVDDEEILIPDINTTIEKGDMLYSLVSGVAKDYFELNELGKLAKELDVKLSLHTPYYMDLTENDEIAMKSMDSIKWGGVIANEMDAEVVVTHLGFYGNLTKGNAMKRIEKNIRIVNDWFLEDNIKPKLGLETSGRQEIFGSLKEILTLCKKVKGTVPVLNFSHIHAREGGSLKKKEDFQEVFDKTEKVTKDGFYTHFSGVEHEGGNEKRYTPIKKGDLRFEPLAECILDNSYDIITISGSPLLEHDAMYMKVIVERVLTKRVAKEMRQKKKTEKKK
jgi:deoxyribonuclease-4